MKKESFADKYAALEFNLKDASSVEILQQIEDELAKHGQKNKRSTGMNGYQEMQSRSKIKNNSNRVQITEKQNIPHNLDMFGSLTQERKEIKDMLKKKQEEEK